MQCKKRYLYNLDWDIGKWSGSALFVIKYVNFYQKSRSSNLIGWKLEVGRGILIQDHFPSLHTETIVSALTWIMLTAFIIAAVMRSFCSQNKYC